MPLDLYSLFHPSTSCLLAGALSLSAVFVSLLSKTCPWPWSQLLALSSNSSIFSRSNCINLLSTSSCLPPLCLSKIGLYLSSNLGLDTIMRTTVFSPWTLPANPLSFSHFLSWPCFWFWELIYPPICGFSPCFSLFHIPSSEDVTPLWSLPLGWITNEPTFNFFVLVNLLTNNLQ